MDSIECVRLVDCLRPGATTMVAECTRWREGECLPGRAGSSSQSELCVDSGPRRLTDECGSASSIRPDGPTGTSWATRALLTSRSSSSQAAVRSETWASKRSVARAPPDAPVPLNAPEPLVPAPHRPTPSPAELDVPAADAARTAARAPRTRSRPAKRDDAR